MPDIHVPDLDDAHDAERLSETAASHRSRSYSSALKIALEVVLISTGVFLGLMGEQWREHKAHHELAQEALRRFRAEVTDNQKRVDAVVSYHKKTREALVRYFDTPPTRRKIDDVGLKGIQPVVFEHTAWDLALATQALSYLDSDLAFDLSGLYTLQDEYYGLTRGMLSSMYVNPPRVDTERFLAAVTVFYDDAVYWEPRLQDRFKEVLPRIDAALGQPTGGSEPSR